jgi:hypothetical protein
VFGLRGFHDVRRANATGLAAEGVVVKTAQTMLGHSEARLTLDVDAQSVAKQGEAAAEAMGARYLGRRRAMESSSDREPGLTGCSCLGSPTWWSACEPERRIELLTYALRVRCSAV